MLSLSHSVKPFQVFAQNYFPKVSCKQNYVIHSERVSCIGRTLVICLPVTRVPAHVTAVFSVVCNMPVATIVLI